VDDRNGYQVEILLLSINTNIERGEYNNYTC